jgi:hypothetical protein
MTANTITATSDCGKDIQIRVPAGSMDPPTSMGRAVMEGVQDPTNWKMPTRKLHCRSLKLAQEVAYAMDWYMGGHEMQTVVDASGVADYVVSSKGYYHYIGS